MSDAAVLLRGYPAAIADGTYLERADRREPLIEEFLRALVARLPDPTSQAGRLRRLVARVNALEQATRVLDAPALRGMLRDVSRAMAREGFTDDLIVPAFAIIREAARRTLNRRHYDVQLMGGWALLQGTIAEMATGEGKTLVATLAACAAAAAGAAVHVISVNDYLAQRDAELNGPLYAFFDLRVGVIAQGMAPAERRRQYACEVVYVSNKEIVFDYMKDQIATGGASRAHQRLRRLYRPGAQPELLLRGLHVAIVDEADSVLVDEARTPLIISETRPDEHGEALYQTALELAGKLDRGTDFEVGAGRDVWFTPAGEARLPELTQGLDGVWTSALWRRELLRKALTALFCYTRDAHYIIADGKVQIVDEFTGRVMPDRSWEHGLHQMIEAKEGCAITGPRSTLARMTYQRFFRRYLLLCGMTGTAAEIAAELRRVYDLTVTKVPTHRPCQRRRLPDRGFVTAGARWQAVAARAAELSQAGRAVLIGTRTIEASECLSAVLKQAGTRHTVLNARQDFAEAQIVAWAGTTGRITVATNMAGRGTDIQLAGAVAASGGLHVILTEFHESARIDRQLFGRSARQGEPGSVEALVSLDDDLFQRYAGAMQRVVRAIAGRAGHVPGPFLGLLVRYAQAITEFKNARVRRATLKQDRKLQRLLAFAGKAE